MEPAGSRSGGTSAEPDLVRQERSESESQKDGFHDFVAANQALFVIPLDGVESLMHVSNLVQEYFAGGYRRVDTEVGGPPKPAWLLKATREREDADLERLGQGVADKARRMDPLALGQTHRDAWKGQTERHVVVDVLQFELRTKTQPAKTYPFSQGFGHSPNAWRFGAKIQELVSVNSVSRELVGKRVQLVLVVIRVHLSRRARVAHT